MAAQTVIPRWRGFNLESMVSGKHFSPLLESDYQWINSGRSDVDYEVFHGHKLDGKLLRLLQKY